MPHVIDTQAMVADGLMPQELANEIAERSRATLLALAVNALLCGGIIAATLGLVFWLADAASVALVGASFLAAGLTVLMRANATYRMFGHAAALTGSGMLIAGFGFEVVGLFDNAAYLLLGTGLAVSAISAWAYLRGPATLLFSTGALMLMGTALHLWGVGLLIDGAGGWAKVVALLYATLVVAGAGTLTDVRAVTALAILPFAQALDTGTAYFHAVYVFYSPEPTLTILQMVALIAVCNWGGSRLPDRFGRHTGILAIMAAVVGNLAFLVASLWGDHIGLSFGRSGQPVWNEGMTWEEWSTAVEVWEARFFHVSEHVFSIVWAVLLAGAAWWAAQSNRRGLFNAAMTFAAIHAYTQAFETFSDEPLTYVIGGLAAIPLAWGIWRLNARLLAPRAPS